MTIPHGLCKAYVRIQSSLEMVVIQWSPLHRSHNMAEGIPGRSEKNQRAFEVINPTKSDTTAELDKGIKGLMFTRFSKGTGSNDGGNFLILSLLQENLMHRGKQ